MWIAKRMLLLILILSTFAYADENSEAQYLQQIVTQADYVSNNQDKIWPGFVLKPVVLFFADNQHLYAFNHFQPTPSVWWQKGKDNYDTWKKSTINNVEYYDLPDSFNTSYYLDSLRHTISSNDFSQVEKIDGQDSYVYVIRSEDDKNKFIYHRFLTYEKHESKGFKSSFVKKKKTGLVYGTLYPKRNTVLSYLMLEALKDYANGNSEALKYYAAINFVRLSEMDLATRNNDEYRDLFYGTASYVDWMSRNISEKQYGQETLSKYALDVKGPLTFDEYVINYLGQMTKLVKHLNELAAPLIGAELDKNVQWSAQWKAEVELGTPLHELLKQYYAMNLVDALKLLEVAKDHYNYTLIEQQINSVLSVADQAVQREIEAYNKDPGIEVILDVPRDQVLDPEFSHGVLLPMDQKQMLGLHLYGQVDVSDNEQESIRFDNIPRMFISEKAGANKRMILKYKLRSTALLNIPKKFYGRIDSFSNNLSPVRFNNYESNLTFNDGKSSVNFPAVANGMIEKVNDHMKVTAVDL